MFNLTIQAKNPEELLEILSKLSGGSPAPVSPAPTQLAFQEVPVTPAAQVAPAVPVAQAAPVIQAAPIAQVPIEPQNYQQPASPAVPVAQAPQYTIEQLGVAAGPLLDAGRGPELSNWLQSKGVQALTQLDKAFYGEFALFLRSLGARI